MATPTETTPVGTESACSAATGSPRPGLSVRDLRVHFPTAGGIARAVDGVSFDLAAGEALAIIGETGSGKTSIARALLGLHPAGVTRGGIRLSGQELIGLAEDAWRAVRWRRIALAAQNAGAAFDPVYHIGEQIAEPLREHLGLAPVEALAQAILLAEQVGLTPRHLAAYPHQLSGGEKQRAMLAMALSCNPEILIVDEPTSGQDMLARAEVITLLRRLRAARGMSLLLISHDLAAVAQLADRVAVLYAGKLVEVVAAADLIEAPRHPYTWGLRNAYPSMTTARDLAGIRGELPDPVHPLSGCRFHPRCTQAVEQCRLVEPELQPQYPPLPRGEGGQGGEVRWIACHLGGLQTLLRARDLRKTFSTNGSGTKVEAVRGASIQVYEGEVVALVGQTGSGKSTLARLIVGLEQGEGGRVELEGQELTALAGERLARIRRRIQYIAQDPFEALSPRLTVAEIVREPLEIQRIGAAAERDAAVREALAAVSLPVTAEFLRRHTHELSGGQLQRVAIARGLVLDPKLLIADEPVSMLDASEQAKTINLLKQIQNQRGMGLLLISHDLALVRKVADRIAVMQHGEIVETGPASRLIARPQHEYTRALLAVAPAFAEA
ncbi:MAG: ABC transporter ATP-binding protein [Chloroflexi bacterium HGW-Chloroflexi-1]|nr:MAG: ABC transporter ATP-binding protein [Chloroflexi bacterium HGW-Chloroflexi-1]